MPLDLQAALLAAARGRRASRRAGARARPGPASAPRAGDRRRRQALRRRPRRAGQRQRAGDAEHSIQRDVDAWQTPSTSTGAPAARRPASSTSARRSVMRTPRRSDGVGATSFAGCRRHRCGGRVWRCDRRVRLPLPPPVQRGVAGQVAPRLDRRRSRAPRSSALHGVGLVVAVLEQQPAARRQVRRARRRRSRAARPGRRRRASAPARGSWRSAARCGSPSAM